MFHRENDTDRSLRQAIVTASIGVLSTAGVWLGSGLISEFVGHITDTEPFDQMAIAHQVEISGSVGGTIHIEPNDTPRAGEENLTWFALTKRGGQTIPLSACDCSLAIYTQPYREGDEAIATPDLRAVSAEGYNGIPGADITFPTAGAYELILTGNPATSGAFPPFELTFSVTVAR